MRTCRKEKALLVSGCRMVYNNYASFDETELKILCSLEYGYTTARTRI